MANPPSFIDEYRKLHWSHFNRYFSPRGTVYFHKVQLVLNRRHGGLGKTQGDEAYPVPLFGGHVFLRFSAGWPPCSGN